MDSIVVSGMGIISSIGVGVDATLASLLSSYSGISKIKHLSTIHNLPCGEVALPDAELRELCGVGVDVVITRTTLLGIYAAMEAIFSAGLNFDDGRRYAFISGTTVGGMEKSEAFYLDFLNGDSHGEYIDVHNCGYCTTQIADFCGIFDFVTTTSTACSSATNAMIFGANLLKLGIVDVAVVGGSECLTKFHLNGFNTLMILDGEPCRPLCATRSGLNLGEGAAYLVIESEKDAIERGAKPLSRVLGYGNACDAYHQTASSPDGRGATLTMQEAIDMAKITPADVDYINVHGTATPNNDESELQAIINVFGDKIPKISSTKAHTGHATSAAGAIEGVISILSIKHRFIAPTLNHKVDMELHANNVKSLNVDCDVNCVMSNSFGFGGNNSSIIFGKCI